MPIQNLDDIVYQASQHYQQLLNIQPRRTKLQTLEMYQPMASEQRQQIYFVVNDLESLSASAFYSGDNGIKFLGDGKIMFKYGNLGSDSIQILKEHK